MAASSVKSAFRVWLILAGIAALVVMLLQAATHLDPMFARLAKSVTPAWFAEFMTRSLFEGDSFGGGDIATLAVFAAVAVYIAGARTSLMRRCGFIAAACIVLGLAVIHPLKFMTGRERPNHTRADVTAIIGQDRPAGSVHNPDRTPRSFPSGHTATAMSFGAIVLAFAVRQAKSGVLTVRPVAFVGGTLLTTLFALTMGAARVARGDHWPTDVFASVLLGWSVFLVWLFMVERNAMGRRETLKVVLLLCLFSWSAAAVVHWAGFSFLVGCLVAGLSVIVVVESGLFRRLPSSVLWLIGVATVVRFLIAQHFPLTNDEAYYWDWGRQPQWSYLDHPPGVAWMTWLGEQVFGGLVSSGLAAPTLAVRGIFPLIHIAATLALILSFDAAAAWLFRLQTDPGRQEIIRRKGMIMVAILAQVTPIFSLVGVFALPDGGLYMSLALALALAIPMIDNSRPVGLPRMAGLGLILGLAFCFKYHAAFVGLALLVTMIIMRRSRLPSEAVGWLVLIASGCLAITPVVVWNLQHDWASFAFQSTRRLSGLEFKPLAGGRVIVGQMLALTPVLFFGTWMLVLRNSRRIGMDRLRYLALALFVPLALLFTGIAFFKDSLPHWVGPVFFVSIPFIAVFFVFQPERALKRQAIRFFFISAVPVPVVALAFSNDRVEQYLVNLGEGDPGYLEEITLWSRLGPVVDRLATQLSSTGLSPAGACQGRLQFAATRWYGVAQLAFHMAGQPRVRTVDADHLSYYHYRDRADPGPCPVLIVGHRRTMDRTRLAGRYRLIEQGTLRVTGHEEVEIDWILASARRSEDWSWTY